MKQYLSKSITTIAVAILISLIANPSVVQSQGLITVFQGNVFTISPTGDGPNDSLIVAYEISAPATVRLVIFENDFLTPVDTLLDAARPAERDTAIWYGTFPDGSPVPDDSFIVFIHADDGVTTQSMSFKITVDNVAPSISITNVVPSIFAPGSPDPSQPTTLTLDVNVADPYPSTEVTVRMELLLPNGQDAGTPIDSLVPVPGSYEATWDGPPPAQQVDGLYLLQVFATDAAGNKGTAQWNINVDFDPPEIEFTNYTSPVFVQTLADSLYGYAQDRNGVDSLFVRYNPDQPFARIASTWQKVDTLFFTVPMKDSLDADSTYVLGFRAVDRAGRSKVEPFSIRWDITPPAAPVLDSPAGPTRIPTYLVTGTLDDDTDALRMYRNGQLIATIFASQQFPYEMSLVPGSNRVKAVALDKAGNESTDSNEIIVVFDTSAGLLISQPFRPDDAFQINIPQAASQVALRIFDFGGNLVQLFTVASASTNMSITWNGLNGDGGEVDKGPLVAVVHATYRDGTKDTFREIFLFEP